MFYAGVPSERSADLSLGGGSVGARLPDRHCGAVLVSGLPNGIDAAGWFASAEHIKML